MAMTRTTFLSLGVLMALSLSSCSDRNNLHYSREPEESELSGGIVLSEEHNNLNQLLGPIEALNNNLLPPDFVVNLGVIRLQMQTIDATPPQEVIQRILEMARLAIDLVGFIT